MPNSVCQVCGATILGGGDCSACELDVVGNCVRFVVRLILFFSLVACASARRQPLPVTVQMETIGSEPQYVHGAHCVDSRAF